MWYKGYNLDELQENGHVCCIMICQENAPLYIDGERVTDLDVYEFVD